MDKKFDKSELADILGIGITRYGVTGKMFDLYTSIIFVDLLVLCITAADAMTNRLLTKTVRNRILILCIIIAVSSVAEFVGFLTNGAPASYITLHKISKLTEFCCAPMTGVVAAIAYGNIKKPQIPVAVVIVHALFECLAMRFNWVFYVDDQNVYHREGLYFVYVIAFVLSVAYIFACVIHSEKEYQTGVDSVLVLTLILLAMGIGIQFIYRDIKIDFLCIIIANYLLYTRHYKTILQVDAITYLLNRRCYESNISNIGPRAAILYFDINKFKQVNDTYGHFVGDICLKNVADRLRSVYGKYGRCYRIGGDEFCVILNSHLDNIDELNEQFLSAIEKLQKEDTRMPNVALGCAFYDSATAHIQQIIEEADDMMYQNKKLMS